MSQTFLLPVLSSPSVNFQEALNQNQATPMNNLVMPHQFRGRDFLIRAIKCTTPDNFGPEFNFFATAAGFTALVATDTAISRFGFVSAMGERLGGAGLWRYYVDGLAIPYFDADTVNQNLAGSLHVVLQNIDATAKTVGGGVVAAGGNISCTFWIEPMQSF